MYEYFTILIMSTKQDTKIFFQTTLKKVLIILSIAVLRVELSAANRLLFAVRLNIKAQKKVFTLRMSFSFFKKYQTDDLLMKIVIN